MSLARQNFVEKLAIFMQDKSTSQSYQASFSEQIQKSRPTCAFDSLPNWLDNDILDALCNDYINLYRTLPDLNNIEMNEDEDLSFYLPDASKQRINRWLVKIIHMAITDLLDNEGFLKQDILTLFNSPLLPNALNGCDIVCAYVGAVNQAVSMKIGSNNEFIQICTDNCKAAGILCHYANRYRQLVLNEFRKMHLFIDEPYEKKHRNSDDRLSLPDHIAELITASKKYAKDNPIKASTIGVSLISVGIGLGFALFKNSQKQICDGIISSLLPGKKF